MPYVAFVLRQRAAAMRQLLIAGAVGLGMGSEESTAIPIAQLRDMARA